MKKLLYLMPLFILTACGGGNGGSSEPIYNNPIPSIPQQNNEIRKSNLQISSTIDNEAKRSAHILATLGEDYYAQMSNGQDIDLSITRGASNKTNNSNICKSERDCNQLAFDNMKYYLIEHINDFDNLDEINTAELKQALILAGFKNDLPGNWDDIKQWFITNKDSIKNQADEIYDQFGQHEDFDITKIDLIGATSNYMYPTNISFILNEDGQIKDMKITNYKDSAREIDIVYNRDSGTTSFIKSAQTYYNYEIIVGDKKIGDTVYSYAGPGHVGQRTFNITSDKKLTLAELKEKFKQAIEEEYNYGNLFDDFHMTIEIGEDGEVIQNTISTNQTEEQKALSERVYQETLAAIDKFQSLEEINFDNIIYPEQKINLQTYGKNIGLAYSDFGGITGDNILGDTFFHGGYEDKQITKADIQKIENEINFSGKAVGSVTYYDSGNESSATKTISGDANLAFNKGIEILTAKFSENELPENRWYDIKITTNENNADIEFSNGNSIDSIFKFKKDDNGIYEVKNFIGDNTGAVSDDNVTTHSQKGAMDINYYGKDGIPTEFTGMATYREHMPYSTNLGNSDFDAETVLEFQTVFGGTKIY